MNIDETQPLAIESVLYRCACGCDVELDKANGGRCDHCGRSVSAKVLNNDLAATMTISGSLKNLNENYTAQHANDYDPNALVGRRFGHYEIVQPLGSGGSGFVYQAIDTSLQRYVAVKVLKSGTDAHRTEIDQADVDLLLQEAVAQARVAHPNIVTIYYVGKQDDVPFYAMELVDGISLSERIQNGGIKFIEISNIAEQLVQALMSSFEMDIIHGDIKPSNIMLAQNGVVKLSDFGLARRISDKNKLVTGGTPNYLAPEILSGGSPSPQSDMYALGVTLFELTFGKLPIQLTGSTLGSWQQSHNDQSVVFPAEWPEHLPPQWRIMLTRLLARDPADRFANYAELADEIEKLSPTSNVAASPLPRLVAAMIDWITVVLFMLPIEVALLAGLGDVNPIIKTMFVFAIFAPMCVYTLIVVITKQSVGRKLMQLRVLNRYGMIPRGRKMALRSVLRMLLPWAIAVPLLPGIRDFQFLQNIAGYTMVAALVFACINTFGLLVSKRHRCIHDAICETQVVIDS